MSRDGVTRLNRGGVIQQNGLARGKYNLYDAIPAYVVYLKESKGDETNVRLIRQRERKLRIQNDNLEDRLVSIVDAAEVFGLYARAFRSDVESRTGQLAAKLSKIDSPRELSIFLQGEFRQMVSGPIEWLQEVESNERKN
jgi:hypothetical protein